MNGEQKDCFFYFLYMKMEICSSLHYVSDREASESKFINVART